MTSRSGALKHTDWTNLVVFCAATSWDGNRFPDQHMAERLARYAPVLYVDPPMSPVTPYHHPELASSLRRPGLRQIGERLARVTPIVPPLHTRGRMRDISSLIRQRVMARCVRRLGGDVHAVVAASFSSVFGVCGERRRVLYGTDDFSAGAALMNVDAERLLSEERRQLSAADTVIVVSPFLQEKWRAPGREPVLVPNGCDDTMFHGTDDAPLPSDVRLKPPIAGFIGHLSERMDFPLLEQLAERGVSLLLVGPRQETLAPGKEDRLLGFPNVQWVGRRPFEALPSYLRAMDVGLVPYTDSEFNKGSFPLKTLEYLAGGRAVVATDLPSVLWLETDLVDVAKPEQFADTVVRVLARVDDPGVADRRRAFAATHGWDRRAADFARAIGLTVPAS